MLFNWLDMLSSVRLAFVLPAYKFQGNQTLYQIGHAHKQFWQQQKET
jgi:hypothetical protein